MNNLLDKDIDEFEIVLQNFPSYADIDELLTLYKTNPKYRVLLDNPYIIKKLIDAHQLDIDPPLTFYKFVEAANKAFLGKGCIKYHTAYVCGPKVAQLGNTEVLNFIIDHEDGFPIDKASWGRIAREAAKGNNNQILNIVNSKVKFEILRSGNPNTLYLDTLQDEIAKGATEGGHLVLIEEAYKEGFKLSSKRNPSITLNYMSVLASWHGHLSIVQFCAEKVNTNKLRKDWKLEWYEIACGAAIHGHVDVFNYAMSKKNSKNWDWDKMLLDVSRRGKSLSIFEFVLSKSKTFNWNILTLNACHSGSLDIFDYAIVKINGPPNWNDIAKESLKSNNLDIFKYALSKGASNWDVIAESSLVNRNIEVFNLAFDKSGVYKNGSFEGGSNWSVSVWCNIACFAAKHKLHNILDLSISRAGNSFLEKDWIRICSDGMSGRDSDLDIFNQAIDNGMTVQSSSYEDWIYSAVYSESDSIFRVIWNLINDQPNTFEDEDDILNKLIYNMGNFKIINIYGLPRVKE